MDADLVSVRYPIFGATVTPSRSVVFGIAYRGSATIEQRVSGELEGDLCARHRRRFPFATRSKRARARVPAGRARARRDRAAASGLARERSRSIGRGGRRIRVPSPNRRRSSRSSRHPASRITPVAPAPLPRPVALGDRFVPRLGVERASRSRSTSSSSLRLGYAYQAAVVPDRQEQTLLVDFDRHVLALGAGSAWFRPFAPFAELHLDVHASLAAGVARTVATGPANAPVSQRVGGNLFSAGATLGLAFDALGRSPEPLAE